MKKRYFFALIPFLIGLSCWIAYTIIGSSVAADGTLVEPFGLIPIGWLFVLAGLAIGAVLAITALSKKGRK